MNNIYNFEIFGKTYKLQTPDGKEEDLIRVIKFYQDAVEELYKKNPYRGQTELLVLAGVKITEQLFNLAKLKGVSMPDEEKKNNEFAREIENLLDKKV